MLLPLQLFLCPGFPSFSAPFQAFSSKALSCLPPDSNRRVGWPIKHSHSKRGRLAAHSDVKIQQQSLLHLLCLPRESWGGNFWRRHIFKYKRLCLLRWLALGPLSMSPIDPHQFTTEGISKGADLQLPEQSLALVSSKAPCEPSLGMKCDFC